MPKYHPLTDKLASGLDEIHSDLDWIDEVVREHLAPPTYSVPLDSGVHFPELEDTKVEVETTFVESGSQVQMLLLGTEPVLVVQPEFNADERKVTFVVTAVDLNAEGMVPVLAALSDATEEIVEHVKVMREEAAEEVFDVNHVDLDPRQEQ